MINGVRLTFPDCTSYDRQRFSVGWSACHRVAASAIAMTPEMTLEAKNLRGFFARVASLMNEIGSRQRSTTNVP
jgi:hypothetical protein